MTISTFDRGRIPNRRAPRNAGGASLRVPPLSFVGQVLQAIRRSGGNPQRFGQPNRSGSRFNARGRGAKIAAGLKGRSAWTVDRGEVRTHARRVAVKARIVKLNPQRGAFRGRSFVSGAAVDAHLRYLQRDGVT